MSTVMHRVVRPLLEGLRRAWDDQRELDERRALLDRPWEEDYLHWSFDGEHWQLHGTVAPRTRRRLGVTSRGWCPGLGRA